MGICEAAPILRTERLILRPHQLSDFPEVSSMWADTAVVRHISGRPFTREESWSRLLRYAGHWKFLGFGYWVVETREDHQFIGEVGLADYQRDISPSQGNTPEAGWVLKSSEHGKGYATEAVSCVLAWADRTMEHSRTFCILDPQHAASINVARKVGYSDDVTGTYRGEPTLVLSRINATAAAPS